VKAFVMSIAMDMEAAVYLKTCAFAAQVFSAVD